MNTDDTSDRPEVIGMAPTFEAFGMVMDLLSRSDVFGAFELRNLSGVIRRQLADGHNLAAVRGDDVLGYAGWLHTTEHEGSEWIENRTLLKARKPEDSDAVALTIFASADPAVTPRLIRGARDLNKGKRVFFKRGYESMIRPDRKSNVLNLSET